MFSFFSAAGVTLVGGTTGGEGKITTGGKSSSNITTGGSSTRGDESVNKIQSINWFKSSSSHRRFYLPFWDHPRLLE